MSSKNLNLFGAINLDGKLCLSVNSSGKRIRPSIEGYANSVSYGKRIISAVEFALFLLENWNYIIYRPGQRTFSYRMDG